MKRLLDILAACTLLLLLSPILLLIAFLVGVKLGRPVIFQQYRPGYKGQIFKLRKFRTMTNARGRDGELLPDKDRLTEFGSWLRRTSLDELPSLWNIVVGDMSFVGPRPLLEEYLALYSEEQARRHDVRPGLTGWAQVNGRNALDWSRRFELDVWYVDNHSIFLDVKIILLTVMKVAKQEGISADTHATMEKFVGND